MEDLHRGASVAALALLVLVTAAMPAEAVVGGHRVSEAAVRWFASVGGCGATLVAPDRVLTAGHCVAHRDLTENNGLGFVSVGGVVRHATHFAMHPGWHRGNGTDNVLDDVAIVELDQPVTDVAPVPLGGAPPNRARILGRGRSTAPGSGRENFDGALREAVLRPISDKRCARDFRHARGNDGEHFDAARMVCAIDADGRPPLSSGCNGDSGGPLYAGSHAAPVVLGVVSWGGSRCGADHLPSVFAEVGRYRAFIADPSPIWAPTTNTPATISGRPRVGSRLQCGTTGFATRPAKVAVTWQRQAGGRVATVGHRRRYTVRRADRGRQLVCALEASNRGGIAGVPYSSRLSVIRVPR